MNKKSSDPFAHLTRDEVKAFKDRESEGQDVPVHDGSWLLSLLGLMVVWLFGTALFVVAGGALLYGIVWVIHAMWRNT